MGVAATLLYKQRHHMPYSGIKFKKSITIDRPAAELYAFWRNLENIPLFVEILESVQVLDNNRSVWTVRTPGGYPLHWKAEIVTDRVNEMIGWRSSPDSEIETAGSIRFEPAPGNRGTVVRVAFEYSPPAGRAGAAVASAFGNRPGALVDLALRRFKQRMETGEITTAAR